MYREMESRIYAHTQKEHPMTCPICQGKGWRWTGAIDNAYREECELCGGKGRGVVNWGPVWGALATLAAWALVCGTLWWVITSAIR